MSRVNRRKAKVDSTQKQAVDTLRKLGISVELGHDDFLAGHGGKTLWVEWKSDEAISKKTGDILEGSIQPDQKRIRDTFKGAYKITHKVSDILDFFGIKIQ